MLSRYYRQTRLTDARRCSNLHQRAIQGQLACALTLFLSTTIYYVTSFVNNVWRIVPITFDTAADLDQYNRFMQDRFVVITAVFSLNVRGHSFFIGLRWVLTRRVGSHQ